MPESGHERGWPSISTPTWPTPTSTGPSCATCFTSVAVDYQQANITVTLDRPDSPRVAHALELLTDELNATPAHLPGDRRPLTYQLAQP